MATRYHGRSESSRQLSLPAGSFAQHADRSSTTFLRNGSLPIHNWFRYSAGFSGLWIRDVIKAALAEGRTQLLDPFAGSGTAVLEAAALGMAAIGIDAHPFVVRIAQTKLAWNADPATLRERAAKLIINASRKTHERSHRSELITRCYPPDTLMRLNALRSALADVADDSIYADLLWLALASILRDVSPVGTASWQYVLPNKTKALNRQDPFEAFEDKIETMCLDIKETWGTGLPPRDAQVILGDARGLDAVQDGWADLVVTSPPYANNYDYADAVRLEMSFFGNVETWSDLHSAVRRNLVCSCSQHASIEKHAPAGVLNASYLDPIRSDLVTVCQALEREKLTHGGKKNYDWMIARYFADMAKFFVSLRRVTAKGAFITIVIGDSAPYGIHVPVDDWFGRLALHAGFSSFEFIKRRDRNIKWKNRKHRVPLHEGELRIQG